MRHFMTLILLCAVGCSSALAAEPTTSDAEYARGKAALKAGDSTTALEAFKSGLAHADDDEGSRWQLVLAIGLTYEEGSQPHHAIEYYQRFLNQSEEHRDALSPKWNKRRGLVQGNITRLEKRMATTFGYVTVASEPTGVQVFVDGKRAGADGDAVTPVGVYLPAGEHLVSVRLAGHELAEKSFTLIAGKIRPLRFALEPEPISASPPIDDTKAEPLSPPKPGAVTPLNDAPDAVVASSTAGPSTPLGPWMVIGTSGLLAIGAAVTAGLSMSARSDWDDYAKNTLPAQAPGDLSAYQDADATWRDHQSGVQTYDILTGTLAGAAALSLGAGLVWLFIGDEEASDAPQLTLTPTAGGAFAHAHWEF
jgi:tetratricopeptide (TPR) repeat protein